jgi:hypothetical protein
MLIIKHQNPLDKWDGVLFHYNLPFWRLMTTQPKQANITNTLIKICNLIAKMHECPHNVRLWTYASP